MTEQTDTNMYCMQIKDILRREILNNNETILSTLNTIIYQEIKEKVIENIQKNLNLFSTNTKNPTINVPDKTVIDTLKISKYHKLYEELVTAINQSNLAEKITREQINY